MTGAVIVADIGPGAESEVRAAAPLAAGLGLRVGPFVVPTALLAGDARVEAEDSDVGDATRAFLRENPWSGMGSVHPGGWMFLARDDDRLVIGQRRGAVGIGAVVTLRRQGSRFTAAQLGGPRLTTGVTQQRVEAVHDVAVDGDVLTVSWDGGADTNGRPLRRADRVLVDVTDTEVHVLLLSVTAGDPRTGWTTGTGMATTSTLRLEGGLRGRTLFSDHTVPAEPLAVDGAPRRTLGA